MTDYNDNFDTDDYMSSTDYIPEPDEFRNREIPMEELGTIAGGTVKCAGAAARMAANQKTIVYTVASGESLESIAGKYHTTVEQIEFMNPGLSGNTNLYVGKQISLPIPPTA